jgi:hypothetical protein
VLKDLRVSPDLQVLRVFKVHLVLLVQLDHKGVPVLREFRAFKVHLALLVQLDHKVYKDLQVLLDQLVRKVRPVK